MNCPCIRVIAKLQANGFTTQLVNTKPGGEHIGQNYHAFLYICHNTIPKYIDDMGLLRSLTTCGCNACKYSRMPMESVLGHLPEDFEFSDSEHFIDIPLQRA